MDHPARPRLRDTGFRLEGLLPPGPCNAITDVPGVAVGHAEVTDRDACTGVTAVLPHPGDPFEAKCPAAVWALNGSGECTGALQINEWGVLETPILVTGTPSVGRVYDGAMDWLLARSPRLAEGRAWVIPCVAECNDGWLNDARRHRAGSAEVQAALRSAAGGPVAEGCVGAGRGMIGFGFKAGVGTASRRLRQQPWHVGALVVCNCGRREELLVAGVPLGRALDAVPRPGTAQAREPGGAPRDGPLGGVPAGPGDGAGGGPRHARAVGSPVEGGGSDPDGGSGSGTGTADGRGDRCGRARGGGTRGSPAHGGGVPSGRVTRPGRHGGSGDGESGGPRGTEGHGRPAAAGRAPEAPDGSIIVVLATDAPLQHPGLRRLCKRGALGLARTGAVAHHGSGDIFIAFSNATTTGHDADRRGAPEPWGAGLAELFQAAAEAVEEAVLNALFAAVDTVGREGRRVWALPVDVAVAVLRRRRPDLFVG